MRRYPGVVVGIVIRVDDPSGEGRIQVKFPWLPDTREYPWAPLATPLTGGGRGMFFMPEPEDEVLVAFEHGDFDHPFIVGFLWNGVDRPPESDPKNRIIVTPGGHTLRFEDGNNAKKIVIRSNGGLEIVLDDEDQSIQLHGGGRVLALRDGQVQIT